MGVGSSPLLHFGFLQKRNITNLSLRSNQLIEFPNSIRDIRTHCRSHRNVEWHAAEF
jgi:hypothetical protein